MASYDCSICTQWMVPTLKVNVPSNMSPAPSGAESGSKARTVKEVPALCKVVLGNSVIGQELTGLTGLTWYFVGFRDRHVKIISSSKKYANILLCPPVELRKLMSSEPLNEVADAAALKTKSGLRRLGKALGYSAAGFAAAWRHEAAFRQLVLFGAVLAVVAFFITDVPLERAILILPVLLSLAIELINSAIEAAVDRVSLELHPLSKRAKDMGSAAQFMALASIVVVWLLVLCG